MNYTTYLRWGAIAGVFLVLFTPFIIASGQFFPNLFFPFITGKNFFFRIVVEIAFLCYVILALRDPRYRPRPSLIMWAAALLFVWVGISTVASVDPIKSFWSNFERMDGYINLIHLFAWFVMTGALLAAEDLWERFFDVSVAASAIMGIDALLQLMHIVPISSQSGARVDTTFGNATYLAVYMLFNFFIALYLLARRHADGRLSGGFQSFYGIALVLQFVALYYTQTRGALLGVIGGLIVGAIWLAIFGKGTQTKTLRRWSLYAIGAIVIVGGLFFAVRNTSFVKNSPTLNRVASISLNDPTVESRFLYIWPTALKGIQEKPVFGWGEENFSYVFNKYYQPEMYAQEQWFDRAHNQFLDFGIASGVPGLALYASLFALSVWVLWRSRLSVPEQAALFGLLAAYGFNNLFVFDNLVSFVYFFAILAYLHSLSRKELPGWMFLSRPMGEQPLAIVAPIVGIVILGSAWYFNAAGIVRANQLTQALQTQAAPTDNLAYFNKALQNTTFPGSPLGRQEAAEQLAQFASNQVAQSSLDPSVKQQFAGAAATGLQDLMTERTNDARLELFMGTLLTTYGAYDQALTYLNQAVADSPKKQQILMQLGLAQIQNGQAIDAIATMRTAFEEEESYDTARVLYASAYYYAGDMTHGDQLLLDKWGSVIVDNDQLLQVYVNLKQWGRAEGIWKLRITADPKNTQNHLGIASVYFAAGDNTNTIAELKQVGQLDPSQAAQMESIITQIQNGTLKP